jgi:hypothetical protein
MNLKNRLKTLERQQREVSNNRIRVVVTRVGPRLDLAKATCSRTVWPDGQLFELVKLNSTREGLSEEDLESFIQSFPIEVKDTK